MHGEAGIAIAHSVLTLGLDGRPPGTSDKGHVMTIIAWILLGLVAGFIGSQIMNRRGEGVVLDIVLGMGGAVVGGFLFQQLGLRGVSGLNLWSLLVAVTGAVVVLGVFHAIRRGL